MLKEHFCDFLALTEQNISPYQFHVLVPRSWYSVTLAIVCSQKIFSDSLKKIASKNILLFVPSFNRTDLKMSKRHIVNYTLKLRQRMSSDA